MKYFVFSDVHSYYDELMTALDQAGFDKDNPEHIIISDGDLCDRGSKPIECLKFICDMLDRDRAICIRGNHEDLFRDVYYRGYTRGHDIHNGTSKTYEALYHDLHPKDMYFENLDQLKEAYYHPLMQKYLNSLQNYYELDNYIFVHGWIPDDKNWRNGDWGAAVWFNPFYKWSVKRTIRGKTIVCGHWSTSYGHAWIHGDGVEYMDRIETMYIDPKTGKWEPHVNHDIFEDKGIIALDACTTISHKVNVYSIIK